MMTMELDVTTALNNNNNNNDNNSSRSSSVNNNNNIANDNDYAFYATVATEKSAKNLLYDLEEQLFGMAKMLEQVFDRGLSFTTFTKQAVHAVGVQNQAGAGGVETFVARLKNFYTILLGLLDCLRTDRSRTARRVGNDYLPKFDICEKENRKSSKASVESIFSDSSNNSTKLATEKKREFDKQTKSTNCEGSSSSSSSLSSSTTTSSSSSTSTSTVSREVFFNNKVERPRTLFPVTTNTSTSQESISQSVNQRSTCLKQSIQNRKTSRRFVTTAVTGAEIAAAYQTLAAATFRKNDIGRQEKTRHASFVSRGTSTPRRKEEFVPSWLTQSLPSLQPFCEVFVAADACLASSSIQSHSLLQLHQQQQLQQQQQQQHELAQQNTQQQQTQTTPLTRDAWTSFHGLPKIDKGIQVRPGEILEPVDKLQAQTASRLDRYKKRLSVRNQLQKIIEEPEEDPEEGPSKKKASSSTSFSTVTSHFQHRRYVEVASVCGGLSVQEAVSIQDTDMSDSIPVDAVHSEQRRCDGPVPFTTRITRPGTPFCGRKMDSARPQFKTIDYFFKNN